MTGNMYFENARIILIFFFSSEYIRSIYLPASTLYLPSMSHKESTGHKELDVTWQLKNNMNHIRKPRGSDGKESAMQETWVLSVGGEDTREEQMATHSSESRRSTWYSGVHLIKCNKENMEIQSKSTITFICN